MAVARAQQHDVAPPDRHSLTLRCRIEVVRKNGVAGHEVVDAAQRRNIEQHAASDDAIAQGRHRVMGRTVDRGDEARRLAVVHHAIEEHVRQRVDVRHVDAVTTDADVLACGRNAVGFAVAVRMEMWIVQPLARLDHEALLLARGILRLDHERARNRQAFSHELGCCDLVGGFDVVESAELIVIAPAAPVRQRVEPAEDFGLAGDLARFGLAHGCPLSGW
jgi:hypothetical protein